MEQVDPARLAESNAELVELLRADIARCGRITFARFMQLALYHPTHGYYATAAVRAGFEGDFLTAPETDPIFGHALARQIAECWERLGRPAPFTVREAGAGRGALAEQIVAGLLAEQAEVLAALRYEIADVNPSRVAEALARVEAVAPGVATVAAGDGAITGVILANELLDALPFHRVVWREGGLHEVWVVWRDGWFADAPGPLSDPRLATPFAGLPLLDGQRAEVSLAAREWARDLGAQLDRGYAILIDYGYPAQELYAPSRAGGTLKTYREHLAAEDPYRHVGRQDITAHVDFSAVAAAAAEGGLCELGLTTQAYFFAGLGVDQLLLDLQQQGDPYRYINARETVLHLMDPRGLGRFRVLVLGKGVGPAPPLRGLAFTLR